MMDTDTMTDTLEVINDDGLSGKYLTFRVDDGDYGVGISYVTEILEMQDYTPIPHTPGYIKGITNLRGTIAPVIDMRLRFGHEETPYTSRTCIIVLSLADTRIGFIVDEVQEVADIGEAGIQPPPKISTGNAGNSFVKAVSTFDGKVKQLIDIDKVFDVGVLNN
jgi:purine-binding chemotaxis protein CheW